MSLDFSGKTDLRGLARVARALQAVAKPLGVDCFLMGAAARDLMVRHAHGIDTLRATEDADFAVMARDWNAFETLRTGLIASREFTARPGPAHRLRHVGGLPLDIVPFGGVERADRTIKWPTDRDTVFDCFGVKEAFAASVAVGLPEGVDLKVAPIPALTVLKVCAWRDRKHTHPRHDAPDILLFLRSYMDCGNLDRAATAHGDLLEAEDFDYAQAGARLLARDMAPLLGSAGIDRMLEILLPETDEQGELLLAQQSGLEVSRALGLLDALCGELVSARPP